MKKVFTLAEGATHVVKLGGWKTAFTLAEVLITLGIIGVVAALTMPSLITKYQEKATAAKLKKVYSVLSNAYMSAINENGEIADWGFIAGGTTAQNSPIFYNNLKPYLKIQKDCGIQPGCLKPGNMSTLDGRSYNAYDSNTNEPKIALADGTVVWFYLSTPACVDDNNCGNIKVDIDGKKGPYTWGKDVFVFNITPKRLYPSGNDETSFQASCKRPSTAASNGSSCTAWVIYNENMDYLHCDDLSWNGKTKCD